MKTIKNIGYFSIGHKNEYGYEYKVFSLIGFIQDGSYIQTQITHIELQWYSEKRYWFAPKIAMPHKSLDSFGDERMEFYENYIQKEFRKYLKKLSEEAWDKGLRMSEDYAIHIRNFLEKLGYVEKQEWADAINSANLKEREVNNVG